MEFIAAAATNIGSSVAAAAAVAQFVGNEVESSAPVQAVQSIKKLTAGQIIKKMQGLESALSILKEQLIASCVMDKNGEPIQKMRKEQKEKEAKEPKETKEPKEKKTKEPKEKKVKEVVVIDENEKKQNKIPMPWTGVADYNTCVALKTQYGLFIQCGKPQDMSENGLIQFNHDGKDCGFCADCFAKCDVNGHHPIGTVQDRLASAVGQYTNETTGKKESHYLDVLTKMNITKEEALEAAEKRGVQIPDWMFEPVEKKRGRPAKMDVASTAEKVEKPMKEKKEKKEKKVASVETADTPEKESANGGEKKKRGRPAKTVQQSNVGEEAMRQLVLQATAAKKKRLSFDPSEAEAIPIQFDDEDDETMSIVSTEEEAASAAAVPAGNVDEVVEVDEYGFFNFDDEEEVQQEEQQQEVVEAVVAAPVEPEKKKKEKKEKVEKKEKKEKKVKADKGEEAAADKKKKSKKAEKKEEAPKESCIQGFYVEAEQVEDEEEELECEEYEYEGETYGLASNGDLYTQDGELVGKVENGVPSFN